MSLERLLKLSAALVFLAACRVDAGCPSGTRESGTRCLPDDTRADDPASSEDAVDDADASVDAASLDDGVLVVPATDASSQSDVRELPVLPMDAGPRDAAGGDARAETGDSGPAPEGGQPEAAFDAAVGADADAAVGADADAATSACPVADWTAWREFQMSSEVVTAIGACYAADPSCRPGECSIAPCLRNTAHVSACSACAAAEVECATKSCAVPCSILTDDDACRACVCAQGCLDAPEACGAGGIDACADCTGASCTARDALASETITLPVFFHLLHDRVDPATQLPAYANAAGAAETILDVDAKLDEANQRLDAARVDGRRLRLIRAGIVYLPAPAAGVCPEPIEWSNARRLHGGLNVVLAGETPSCPALATSAFAARASATTLLRAVGNMLGIQAAAQQGEPWQTTGEQFVRMHDYARWRLGASDAVPEAEKHASLGLMHGPQDPIWDKRTNRDWALSNASLLEASFTGSFSLPFAEDFVIPATRAARRILGVRVRAKFSGVPSENLRIVINIDRFRTTVIPRGAVRVGADTLVAEDAYNLSSGPELNLGDTFPQGRWGVSIEDSADLTLREVRLEIVVGDRGFRNFDRHSRAVSDIMVYRPATSELLTALNPANGTTAFGAFTHDLVPPLPHPSAKITVGDIDGDGTVDLVARYGALIWTSFYKSSRFGAWLEGSIKGTDRPTQSDQVLIGDIDGDGFGDLIRRRLDRVANQARWACHRGIGDGTFEAGRIPANGPPDADIVWTFGDFGHTALSHLMYRQNSTGYMVIVYNVTPRSPTTGSAPAFYGGFSPTVPDLFLPTDRLITLDVNHDGEGDVVAYRPDTGEWSVYLNENPDLAFGRPQRLTIGGTTSALMTGDIILGAMP